MATAVYAPQEHTEQNIEKEVSIYHAEDGNGRGFVGKTSCERIEDAIRYLRRDAKKGSSPTNKFFEDLERRGKILKVRLLAVVNASDAAPTVAYWVKKLTDEGFTLLNTRRRQRRSPAPEPEPGREMVERFKSDLGKIGGRFKRTNQVKCKPRRALLYWILSGTSGKWPEGFQSCFGTDLDTREIS